MNPRRVPALSAPPFNLNNDTGKTKLGQHLQIKQEDGQVLPVLITDVSALTVTLDANHLLAGQDLTFDIHLVAIV